MFVSDLRHFLDMPDDVPAPARRMAEHLISVVRAATAGDAGLSWVTAITCMRRPAHRACPGHLTVLRTDVPSSIEWRCESCGDAGVISGWERSLFDLRSAGTDGHIADGRGVIISTEVAATLRGLTLIDSEGERRVFRARVVPEGILLDGDEDDLDELLGYIAAEANHEQNRGRRRRLDAAFDLLRVALAQSGHR